MYEINEVTDLSGIMDAFPTARKVTVDMANKTLYVFTGRGNRATVVTGAEFDKLVKTLPAGEKPPADETTHEVETEEDIFTVVKEPDAKARGKRPKEN